MHWYLYFVYKQYSFTPYILPGVRFDGETVIITGGNTGLGLEAAIHVARLGAARVIITSRDAKKGAAALSTISGRSGNPKAIIEVWDLDLTQRGSIEAFAKRASSLDRLDRLLENAGLVTPKFATIEGVESHVAVSVNGTFYLLTLLMPVLRKTAVLRQSPPTVTIVSSALEEATGFPERKNVNILASLNDKKSARMLDRYNVVKLMQILLTRHLARQLQQQAKPGSAPEVTINCCSPGLVDTGLQRELGIPMKIFKWIHRAYDGPVGTCDLVNPLAAGSESNGKFMLYCEWQEPSAFAKSAEGDKIGAKIWAELAKQLDVPEKL